MLRENSKHFRIIAKTRFSKITKCLTLTLDTEIEQSNIGRKMLEKSGWKKGQGLGARGQGIKEPIRASHQRAPGNSSGIGSSGSNRKR